MLHRKNIFKTVGAISIASNMKKLLKIILILLILINMCVPTIYADDEDDDELTQIELQQIVESGAKAAEEPILNSKSAIIYDRTTKKVIWGKNEYKKRAMASTTKIMTAIVVLENSKLTDTVTVSKKAANTGGSSLKLKENDKVTINDLLYGLMLRSRKR